ncbi:glycosyltransferase family 1 protein [Trichocoleus sp. FACHB-262]|uniref:glycosyltransferase family 4 protein n=1 Tax=Trichocoleus sp. FACHB-262 TaxID=2692869 RepID=UPI001687893D|nr:glycosyltransferase family 1 protein [Trichocoleus sp. FACHB-262]MBD2124668.1 glycosyltransferase family 4 protein [Trichocoleus sp. FACHB-262]
MLKINFFTIVLNGKPFIHYHINVFNQLSFDWHWHIVEGVADLKHDTAWSRPLGGQITDEIHRNGLSKDGTSEYLDELVQRYPDNITLYRKTEGSFWDGKLEMVNAPLSNIQEECLLWQVDVDELWTVEQIDTARRMFIKNPEKTAAFYWCWYFVGERLLISTRNCYAQNPQQEWLRTWRFKPGAQWAAHEPPVLMEPSTDGQWSNVAAANPFSHAETEQQGLVFQHFAYTTAEQLQFKEQYYGYKDAVSKWQSLQEQNRFPIMLRQHFSWVHDNTMVDTAESMRVMPIAQRNSDHDAWYFLDSEALQQVVEPSKPSPIIVVDGVFFQLYKTGIARVWRTLLEEWVETGFAQHIVFLDRARSAPIISGINYRLIPSYDYNAAESDREMLQEICEEENADLFISTYYTTPLETPSVFMAYDMIPEVMNWNLNHAMWRQKHHGIQHASAYITISENTARDLVTFFPDIDASSVTVALCGVKDTFSPVPVDKIQDFKMKYGIFKPYFILAGAGSGYKNSILFFKAFAKLYSRSGFDVICTGSNSLVETEFRDYTAGSTVHMLQLDDNELRAAYSGALALVYPSKYEGFGLPIVEAMACGCPVITCPNASIPEVAGEAALYIQDNDVEGLVNALCDIQKPQVRQALTARGLEQARSFSWKKMAEKVRSSLIEATLLPLKLNEINLVVFPDWTQPEESLQLELSEVIRAIAAHPNKDQITLLIDNSNIAEEDANLFLSGIAMALFLEEDLDVSQGPEVSWCGQLSKIQWSILSPHLNFWITLSDVPHQTLVDLDLENIPSLELQNIKNIRV